VISLNRRALFDLLLLSAVAGSADAAGYLGLGRVFTANMTGNVVLMGIAIGQGHLHEAVRSFYALVVFTLGTSLGVWMTRQIDRKDWRSLVRRGLSWEAAVLCVLAVLWFEFPASDGAHFPKTLLFLLAFSMGLQSAVLNRLNVPGMATTAVTSTVASVVSSGVQLSAKSGETPDELEALRLRFGFGIKVLCVYSAGAAVSGFLVIHDVRMVAIVPAVLVLLVVLRNVIAARRTRLAPRQ
jgi:uncharacterized membrane protein YoaK (UPF0700 family)